MAHAFQTSIVVSTRSGLECKLPRSVYTRLTTFLCLDMRRWWDFGTYKDTCTSVDRSVPPISADRPGNASYSFTITNYTMLASLPQVGGSRAIYKSFYASG